MISKIFLPISGKLLSAEPESTAGEQMSVSFPQPSETFLIGRITMKGQRLVFHA